MKQKILKKLTSRKMWTSIATFVAMLLVALNYSKSTAETVAALIMAGGTMIAYIVSEGFADAAAAGKEPKNDGDNNCDM